MEAELISIDFSIKKDFSISIITKHMSICKPQNRNTDIYYLDILSIRNYHKIILLHFMHEWKFSFDRARPGLCRIEPAIKEKSIAICIRV